MRHVGKNGYNIKNGPETLVHDGFTKLQSEVMGCNDRWEFRIQSHTNTRITVCLVNVIKEEQIRARKKMKLRKC